MENQKEELRLELEKKFGKDNVWDTDQLTENFAVIGFQAPYVVVTRLSDKARGSLTFTHMPRLYYDFIED